MNENLLIELHDVTVRMPGQSADTAALKNASLLLKEGKHCLLLGENGAGKSTLLRVLRGEQWISSGKILWYGPHGAEDAPLAGRAMTALVSPARQAVYRRQGWRLTGRELLLTGFDDVPLIYTAPDEEKEQAVIAAAERLNAAHLLEKNIESFSQGQLRAMLLARALVAEPQVLLLDECTEGLDRSARSHFLDVLGHVAENCTLVMTSHRADLIPELFDEHLYLSEGRISSEPPKAGPEKRRTISVPLFSAPNGTPADAAAMPDEKPLIDVTNATVYVRGSESFDSINWILHQAGHASDHAAVPAAENGSGRSPALVGVSFTLRRGESWIIYGANGSGKSTLLRLLAGDEYPAAGGSIAYCLPRHGGETTLLEDIRRGVRLVSDLGEATYSYDLTVSEFVASGLDNSIGNYRDFSETEKDLVAERLRLWGLESLASRSFRTLSSGQLRLCSLARALMGSPEVLLLDEPCSGLDARTREAYLTLLQSIAESGISVVLVSHHDADRIPAIRCVARMEAGNLAVLETA